MSGLRVFAIFVALSVFGGAQELPVSVHDAEPFPSPRAQREEMLKQEHRKALEDAERLVELAHQLKAEIEKNDHYVLSLPTLQKAEQIQKLAGQIRKRLKRF
jgi:hypothetical protein